MTKNTEIASKSEVILSVREAAEMLGKGRSTVNRWINEETLPATRNEVGDHEIKESDVIAFMKGGQQVSSASKIVPLQPAPVSSTRSESAHQQGREPELVESSSTDEIKLLEEQKRALNERIKQLEQDKQLNQEVAEKLALKRDKEILESEKDHRNKIQKKEEESKTREVRLQREHEHKLLVKDQKLVYSEERNKKQREAIAASDSYAEKQDRHEKKIMERSFFARVFNFKIKKDFERKDFSHLLTDQSDETLNNRNSVDNQTTKMLTTEVENKILKEVAKTTDTVS